MEIERDGVFVEEENPLKQPVSLLVVAFQSEELSQIVESLWIEGIGVDKVYELVGVMGIADDVEGLCYGVEFWCGLEDKDLMAQFVNSEELAGKTIG